MLHGSFGVFFELRQKDSGRDRPALAIGKLLYFDLPSFEVGMTIVPRMSCASSVAWFHVRNVWYRASAEIQLEGMSVA